MGVFKIKVKENGVCSDSYIFFTTSSILAKKLFYYVKTVGKFFCNENYRVERTHDNSFLILYVISGEIILNYNNKNNVGRGDDLFFIDCKVPHTYYATEKSEILWIHLDGNNVEGMHEFISKNIGDKIGNVNRIVYENMLNLFISYKNEKEMQEAKISCIISTILTELWISSSKNQEHDSSIDIAKSYIERNFYKDITINGICENIYVSKYHFIREFKKKIGYSPYEFITILRLNYAKEKLINTSKSIKEIAFDSGFNSESNFSKCFKKHNNMSPIDFRKKYL